jgi:outer membrane protein assembly factor BamB
MIARSRFQIASLIVCLLGSIASATALEHLGQPCRGFNVLASRVVTTPDGKEWFVLSNTNERSGVELIFIDFSNKTGKKFSAPAGQGAWMLNQVPGDRLVVGTYYDGKLMVFDLKTLSFKKTIGFGREEYFWNGAIGGDGRLYAGTYPGGKLAALDLDKLAIEDCGAPAAPNLYLRNVSALPDGRLLCNFVTSKPTRKIFDPAAKQWADVPEHFRDVASGVTWNGYFLSGTRAFTRDLAPVDPPPFITPDGEAWHVHENLTSAERLYLKQGARIWWLLAGGRKLTPTKVFDHGIPSAAITAVAPDGTLLGIRGQDYLVARPGELKAKLIPIPVEPSPRPVHFIEADGDGRLWGGPPFGQTLFFMDLATGKTTNTGIVVNAGGEVYDLVFADGKAYGAAYVGGDIFVFDPREPWDQLGNKNPRSLARLNGKGYIRPVAGIHLGDDGRKLYSGWMANYGKYGGAIAVTDRATGETTLWENPLGEQAVSAMAVVGDVIYAGTTLAGNGLPNKPNEKPQFGILDRATGRVSTRFPIDGGEITKIFHDAKGDAVFLVVGPKLLRFNLKTNELYPAGAPPITPHAADSRGDGKIWFGSGKSLVCYDVASGDAKTIAAAPAKIDHLDVAPTGDVFIACGADVYRMKTTP